MLHPFGRQFRGELENALKMQNRPQRKVIPPAAHTIAPGMASNLWSNEIEFEASANWTVSMMMAGIKVLMPTRAASTPKNSKSMDEARIVL
jgi:hypothetical protein